METNNELKGVVKNKYAEIAVSSARKSCCGSSDNKIVDYTIIKDEYKDIEGYLPDADLGLGCGLPTEYAGIKPGDTVLDLGSGAGNDVFVARALAGDSGIVYGLDFTDEMIIKAEMNKDKLGYTNVHFKSGDIESMPFQDNLADVVISNCVLNLVPDKEKAFSEIFRVLKHGGHFCVSDIIISGELHPELKKSAEMYAGCVSGAVQKEDYLNIIAEAGFNEIEIKRTKPIQLPDEVLKKYLSDDQISEFNQSSFGIFSITVTGVKS